MPDSYLEHLKEKVWSGRPGREDLVHRVAHSLRDLILGGDLKPGAKLTPEAELARKLSVSRPSLREAIRILSQEGLLDVRHGVGTFVTTGRKPMVGSLELMRSMTDFIRESGGVPSCRDLEITLEVAPAKLELPVGTEVAHIRRTRQINGRAFVFANEYVVLDGGTCTFEAISAFDGSSLYGFLRERIGLTISHSRSQISAVAADTEMSRLLEVPRKAPMILMSETHFDREGNVVLVSVNHHNSAVVQFTSVRWGMPL